MQRIFASNRNQNFSSCRWITRRRFQKRQGPRLETGWRERFFSFKINSLVRYAIWPTFSSSSILKGRIYHALLGRSLLNPRPSRQQNRDVSEFVHWFSRQLLKSDYFALFSGSSQTQNKLVMTVELLWPNLLSMVCSSMSPQSDLIEVTAVCFSFTCSYVDVCLPNLTFSQAIKQKQTMDKTNIGILKAFETWSILSIAR